MEYTYGMYLYMYIYICICMYVCMYIYIYIYIYIVSLVTSITVYCRIWTIHTVVTSCRNCQGLGSWQSSSNDLMVIKNGDFLDRNPFNHLMVSE